MSDFLKAADDARRLLRGFKAFEEVAAALEMAGIAQQTKAEAESKLAFLLTKIETAKVEAEEQAGKNAETVAAASKRAEEIVAAAGAKAVAIVADAQTKAANETQKAVADRKAAEDARAAAFAEAAEVMTKRDALLAEVSDLEKRVDKARAYLAKLAG
jgi:colicin import membrane protein